MEEYAGMEASVGAAEPAGLVWWCYKCNQNKSREDIGMLREELKCKGCGLAGFIEVFPSSSAERFEHAGLYAYETNSTDSARPELLLRTALPFNDNAGQRPSGPEQGTFANSGENFMQSFLPWSIPRDRGFVVSFSDSNGEMSPVHASQTSTTVYPRRLYTFDTQAGEVARNSSAILENDRYRDGCALENMINTALNFLTSSGSTVLNNIVHVLMVQENEGRCGTPPASASIVASLPDVVVTKAMAVGDCVICQENFVEGDVVKSLSQNPLECPHMFHAACILPWLKQHNSCPVCRFELLTDDEAYEKRKKDIKRRVNNEIERRCQIRLQDAAVNATATL